MAFVIGFICGIMACWMVYRVRKMIDNDMNLFAYEEDEFEDTESEEDDFFEEEEVTND